ncbi:MAG: lipid kinase [Gammaproteobacteria bacterium]|nr:lipid kinase [Gammaproteobacteria bacterium]
MSADTDTGRTCLLVLNTRSRGGEEHADAIVEAIGRAGWTLAGDGPVAPEDFPAALEAHRGRLARASGRILVGGGDGTVHHLLPELMAAGLPVAVLPLGTANDLARTLGLSLDPHEALETALAGRLARIDLGRVNDTPFANVASIGLGPEVTERLSASMKRDLGIAGYPLALLRAYREVRPFRCRVTVDGERVPRFRAIHLAVGNGRYYGGGATVFSDARIDDQTLHFFGLSPEPFWRLVLKLPWLALGYHRQLSNIRTLHGRTLELRISRPLPISADGELVAETPARFEVLEGALVVVVPETPDGPGLGAAGDR